MKRPEAMNSKTCGRGCQQNWDVRCCCELNCPAKNSLLQFHKCPMRLNTTYFCIGNDREIYKLAENNNWKPIKRIFGMNKKELKQIKKWWYEDHKSSSDEESAEE